MKYSLVFPCKDEEETIGICISKVKKFKDMEIIVVDNNSIDDSAKMARNAGAKIIKEQIQGYGAALKRGFLEANGDYVIMCDADDTYDLKELPKLMKYANTGKYDIVMGQRKYLSGDVMTLTHKIGNNILSAVLRTFYKIKVKDSHSGFRIIKREALERMRLQTDGMDLASEMLMQAAFLNMSVKEVPIHYYARKGESKLRSIPDGWKHLRLMLLYSPNNLYLIPGLLLMVLGMIPLIALMFGPVKFLGISFRVHPMFLGSMMIIVGYQILMLWLYTRIYIHNIFPDKLILRILAKLKLEQGVILGILLTLLGVSINLWILFLWLSTQYGKIDIRWSIIGLTIMILGIQTFFASFYLSILGITENFSSRKKF